MALCHNGRNMTSSNPAQGRHQFTIGVTALAWLNLYQNLKQIIQDAIARELQGIKAEIKALSQRIDSIDDRLGRFESRMDKRFDEQGRQWETAIDVRERLAFLEARLPRQ